MRNLQDRIEKLEIKKVPEKYNIVAIENIIKMAPHPFDKHIGESYYKLESLYPNADFYVVNIVEG